MDGIRFRRMTHHILALTVDQVLNFCDNFEGSDLLLAEEISHVLLYTILDACWLEQRQILLPLIFSRSELSKEGRETCQRLLLVPMIPCPMIEMLILVSINW